MKPKKTDIDMSPAAIGARLEDVRALYRLTTSLAQARIEGPVAAPHVKR